MTEPKDRQFRKSLGETPALPANKRQLRVFLVDEDFNGVRIFPDNVKQGEYGFFQGTINEGIRIGEKIANSELTIQFLVVDIIHTLHHAKNGIIHKYIVLRRVI